MTRLHEEFPLIATYTEVQFDQFILKLISISRGLGILNSDKSSMKTVASFISNQFGNDYTMNEVSYAFELNSAKKLNCDTKPYTTFNLEYVGAILNAYKEYRQHSFDKTKQEQRKQLEPPPQTIAWMDHAKMMHGIISDYIKEKNKLPVAADWEAAYDYLTSIGELKITNEEKNKIATNVRAMLAKELSMKKFAHQDYKELEKDIADKKFIAKSCRENIAKDYYQKQINKTAIKRQQEQIEKLKK